MLKVNDRVKCIDNPRVGTVTETCKCTATDKLPGECWAIVVWELSGDCTYLGQSALELIEPNPHTP